VPRTAETTPTDEIYWDPYDWNLHANPHPIWRRMREEAPLYRNDKYDFWALTRFQDVSDVLADWKTYTSSQGPILEQIRGGRSKYAEGLLSEDPPIHDLHRQMLARAFTPRSVKQIENRVRGFAQRLLDERIGSGGFDFVEDYGARVPGMVIAAMLGTPDSDLEEIRHLTDAQLIVTGRKPFDRKQFNTMGGQLWDYFMGHVHARRKNPTDDLMSELVAMEFTDEKGVTRKLTDTEACQYIKLLSAAGNETTARFIGWAGATLGQFPDQRAKLVARPDLIPNGVEEILRFEPPAMALARVVTRDVVWHDQVVPEGSVMVVIQAATGRDQRQFPDPDPDTFDVERKIDRILSFGYGTHICMGASLARLEGRIVVEEMLKRFPEWDVEWDKTEIVHTGSSVRGYSKLPIVFP
jgi:cytochrome P450